VALSHAHQAGGEQPVCVGYTTIGHLIRVEPKYVKGKLA
jgi:hypothetical protein